MSGRSRHASAILGQDLFGRLSQTKVLLVGAGGIGCELLKNIVLTGFGDITLLDLDTIDLSNLNRQFLFRKKDIKQSKAMVAAKTASAFNPNVKITPIHANIKEPQFDVSWFRRFHLVLNALDNLEEGNIYGIPAIGRLPVSHSGVLRKLAHGVLALNWPSQVLAQVGLQLGQEVVRRRHTSASAFAASFPSRRGQEPTAIGAPLSKAIFTYQPQGLGLSTRLLVYLILESYRIWTASTTTVQSPHVFEKVVVHHAYLLFVPVRHIVTWAMSPAPAPPIKSADKLWSRAGHARRHVNKMCMAANVPLVESGTAGYLGQVQPILKDRAECFDCVPKPTPKTFPVCTIRSTPSQPIHCIVWAKSYLLPQLFGEDEDGGELDEAEKQGENASEIAALRKEAQAFKAVRTALRSAPSPTASSSSSSSAAKAVFTKVFHSDILNLLSMADMWRSRAPPTPLDFDQIRAGSFASPPAAKPHPQPNGVHAHGNGNVDGKPTGSSATEILLNGAGGPAGATGAGLKDQRALSLQDNLELFVASTERLAARVRAGEETIAFDKDDEDTLDFVTAAANLRSAAYGIPGKSRWEVKEMAGNIIPAIATTNAIIAGLIVLQALHLLRKSYDALRNVHVQFKPSMPLSAIAMCPPNSFCGVCRDTYTEVLCDPARVTLQEVVDGILGAGQDAEQREVSVYEDKRVLSDPDWDDNNGRTLESLNVTRGTFLSIVDEEGEYATVQVAIGVLPPNHPVDAPALVLPEPLPRPPRKERPRPATPSPPTPSAAKKRPAPDDIEEIDAPPAKRGRMGADTASAVPFTPSKKRRLEEDGLIILDSAEEKIEEQDPDVIEID
ncbi:hypothetical protein BD309DRAFT_1012010 [Dichomitus squalens]|nr:hypothetical protein BD309DRAFT_1012010 [Dichomitus squalens]